MALLLKPSEVNRALGDPEEPDIPAGGPAGIPLAVRLPNWVGDVCMAVPTLIQLTHSGFTPVLLGRPWAASLLSSFDYPVHTCRKSAWSGFSVSRRLGAKNGLLLTNSFKTALQMRLSGIQSVGFRAEGRSWLLRSAVEKASGVHEVEHFWSLGRACAAAFGAPQPWPIHPPSQIGLPVPDSWKSRAAAALHAAGTKPRYYVLCPFAAGTTRGQSKVWPHWRELAERLAGPNHSLVVCPGPGEEHLANGFIACAIVLPGLSLDVYAGLLAGAELAVANDSGPMHLAAAAGAHVVGIFGPGDPGRTRPWGGLAVGGNGRWPSLDEVTAACRSLVQGCRAGG